MKKVWLVLLAVLLSLYAETTEVTTFTYQIKQSQEDKRFDYDYELLKLVLDKTIQTHGAYKLEPIPINVNYKRIESLNLLEKYENLIFKHSVSDERLKKFAYVAFPIDRGIVGYRVGFIPQNGLLKFKQINTLEDFKKITILQGPGWLDVQILRQNGFKVIEGSSYEGLFQMISKNRADLLLRGANELLYEWSDHKEIKGLDYDKNLLLYYPLPRFFFSHPKNKKALDRIHEGLIKAYQDKSLLTLWYKHYSKSIEFTKLYQRKVFYIENPYLKNLDDEYKKYNYKPDF